MSLVCRLSPLLSRKVSSICTTQAMSSKSMFVFPDGRKMRVPPLPSEIADKYIPGQMFKNQASLPSLPVNSLEQSLSKYLTALEPIVGPDELAKTRAIAEDFKKPGGIGEQLQRKLVDRASKHDSWLIDWWNHVAYLAFRDPTLINVTPAITYPFLDCSTRQAHVETATKVIMGMIKMYQIVQMKALPPESIRGKNFCMWQYPRLYGCRISGKEVDTFEYRELPDARHIIIMRKGIPYKMTLLYDTNEGEIVMAPPTFIMDQLHWILEDAVDRPQHVPGVMTEIHRDRWYEARQRLRKDSMNRASMDEIESSVMVFCLDEAKPDVSIYRKQNSSFGEPELITAKRTLHGGGTECNSINRWFDCTTQIVIGEDGGCGSIMEHSGLDGVVGIASTRFVLDMMFVYNYDFLGEKPMINESSLKPAERLNWNLSEESIMDIQSAYKEVDKLVSNVDFHVTRFEKFGQKLLKDFKLSPDGFIQVAIQLTFYKLYGESTATYESGATRLFKKGRTDTIRSATNESHAFAKSMCDPQKTQAQRRELLISAVKAHSQRTAEAVTGQAFDRHLLGLRILAGDAGIPMPEIFTDPTYQKSLHFKLSTSQVPIPNHDVFLSFGAVVPDGYGVCYNPQLDQIMVCISSYCDCPETDSQLFATKLKESLSEMGDVVTSVTNSKL